MLVMRQRWLTALIMQHGFLGLGSGRCNTHLLVRSTAVKATVVYMEIVVMLRWNWVLLLLMMIRGFVANATCVAKLAT